METAAYYHPGDQTGQEEPNFQQVIILMGPEGSGKSTQAGYLAAESGLPHVATGDLLRAAAANPESLYHKEARLVFAEHRYASAEAVYGLTREFFLSHDLSGGVIIDGYFRIPEQVDELASLMEEAKLALPVQVFHLWGPQEVFLARQIARGRGDDTEEGNKKRHEQYYTGLEERLAAIEANYNLTTVNADQPEYTVYQEIRRHL